MLTDKQEKFCLNIVSGMNQADAYRNSYDAQNMADDTIYAEASKLMSNHKVTTRIEKLRDKAANSSIMSAIQRKEFLTNMILNDTDANRTDKLKALDILNKMDGEYITKIEADVDISDIRVELRDE